MDIWDVPMIFTVTFFSVAGITIIIISPPWKTFVDHFVILKSYTSNFSVQLNPHLIFQPSISITVEEITALTILITFTLFIIRTVRMDRREYKSYHGRK